MPDENTLIAAATAGSAEAFSELVAAYQARVRGYLARWVRDPSQVDDLAQEVFLSAYRGLAGYRGESPFGVWLAGIARNQAVGFIRTEARRNRLKGDMIADQIDGWRLRALENDSERLAERLSAVDMLKRCLETLPASQRSLVEEHYLAGRSACDIAKDRDLAAGAVRMALLRVRQTLRACIERRPGAADLAWLGNAGGAA